MLVVNKPSAYEASKKQLEALAKLTKFGFSPALAAAALIKAKNNVDDAFAMCKDKPLECFKLPGSSKAAPAVKGKLVKKSAGGNKQARKEEIV
jgi:hypothetical protein